MKRHHYTQETIAQIFSEAERVFYMMATPRNVGGYLALYQLVEPKSNRLELLQIGHFGEWDYDTRDSWVLHQTLCESIIQAPYGTVSSQEAMGIRGAIRINYSLLISFVGFMESEKNETLVVATIIALRYLLDEKSVFGGDGPMVGLDDLRQRTKNPMLSDDVLQRLMRNY